jgi:hypothetical protein
MEADRTGGHRAIALAIVAAAALAAGATPGASQDPRSRRTGVVSGDVRDAVTGRPVAGATVTLRPLPTGAETREESQWRTPPRMVTDSRGRFLFQDLAGGDYFMDASSSGYEPTRYGWTAPGGSSALRDIARLAVAEGQWLRDISVPLWPRSSIEGHVFDERGEPVVGVAVRGFSRRMVAGREQLVGGPIATTDDRGAYRLSRLPPGRYTLAVLSVQQTVPGTMSDAPQEWALGQLASGGIGGGRGASVRWPTVDVGAGGRHRLALSNFATPPPPREGQPNAYPAVFYPTARSLDRATAVEIDYGDDVRGIDFRLAPVPVARVAGRLESAFGPPPPFLLRLMPVGSEQLGFGSEAATTVVEPDGRFVFLNVPEGSYTLLAQASVMDFNSGGGSDRFADAPGFPAGGITVGSMRGAPGLGFLTRSGQAADVWGRVAVDVSGQPRDDVVVPLRPTVTISGRIVLAEGTTPPVGGRLLMHAQPADGDPSMGQPGGGTSRDDPTMAFSIGGLLGGTYLLRSFNGLAVMSATWNGRDLGDTGFDAAAGHDFTDVVVTLTDREAAIQGRVTGNPGPTAAVLAFPVTPQHWTNYGWDPARIQTARTATDGSFTLTDLPKGDYFVIAVDVAQLDAWADPAFLKAASTRATRVSLDWGDDRTLNLDYQQVVVR